MSHPAQAFFKLKAETGGKAKLIRPIGHTSRPTTSSILLSQFTTYLTTRISITACFSGFSIFSRLLYSSFACQSCVRALIRARKRKSTKRGGATSHHLTRYKLRSKHCYCYHYKSFTSSTLCFLPCRSPLCIEVEHSLFSRQARDKYSRPSRPGCHMLPIERALLPSHLLSSTHSPS